jgi:adenine-specific DNA-methyltransferase
MPVLNWIGKEAVRNHHQAIPFRLLREVASESVGDIGAGNLIVEGDNLLALKALLPYYAAQIKCIYIDPPYNTGNENWVYNDNVNNPTIRRWLGSVVGKEAEDLSRHDKWLCMMYPRLALLQQFLKEDGVLFVSIDEDEISNLLQILDELFGRRSRLAIFTWVRKKKGSNLSKEFRKITEYVVAYKRSALKVELHGAPAYAEKLVPLLNRPNPVTRLRFPRGSVRVGRAVDNGMIYAGTKGQDKGELAVTLENDITVEDGVIATEFSLLGRWRWSQKTVDHELANGSEFIVSKDFRINVARFNQGEKFKAPASLLSPDDGIGTNEDATEELRSLFNDYEKLPFDFPKPSSLIQFLVRSVCKDDKEAIILDSFAGSGTTAQAVLQLNTEDKGHRKFVLVEIDRQIARRITAERVRRVISGYKKPNGERVEGVGGAFRYCELGEPLFDSDGDIRKSVTFAELARHIYFTETGEPLPRERVKKSPLLGITSHGVAVYLLYNGILEDRSVNGGNILTSNTLSLLTEHVGPKILYAAGCRLSTARLKREVITFKQTPYAIKLK